MNRPHITFFATLRPRQSQSTGCPKSFATSLSSGFRHVLLYVLLYSAADIITASSDTLLDALRHAGDQATQRVRRYFSPGLLQVSLELAEACGGLLLVEALLQNGPQIFDWV